MTTRIDDAVARARCELESVETKRDAIDRFRSRVADLPPEPAPSSPRRVTATAGVEARSARSTDDRCQAVRRAFAETVRPHCGGDGDEPSSLHATIRAEFSEPLAAALAPTTDTSFSPRLKRAILSEAGTRRIETDVLARARSNAKQHGSRTPEPSSTRSRRGSPRRTRRRCPRSTSTTFGPATRRSRPTVSDVRASSGSVRRSSGAPRAAAVKSGSATGV